MSEPLRFDPIDYDDSGSSVLGEMDQCDGGNYVLFEDLQKLRSEKEQAERENLELKKFNSDAEKWLDETEDVLSHAVEIMTLEQLSLWQGCRAIAETKPPTQRDKDYIHRDKVRAIKAIFEDLIEEPNDDGYYRLNISGDDLNRLWKAIDSSFDNGGGE